MTDLVFGSFFLAGFECSTHKRWDNRRIDMISATGHESMCENDYALALRHGLRGARDGFRWHLIEQEPGLYDWSSIRPMLQAANRQSMTVIWDLCHYGYPDWLDIWSEDFVSRFADYAAAAATVVRAETGAAPLLCPMNEISFWSWLGGKEGKVAPYTVGLGAELKRVLVRAKLAAIRAIRHVDAEAVVFTAEPLINVVPDTLDEEDIIAARLFHWSQYEATDLVLGRVEPELGGFEGAVDVIGVNYYPHNQWRIRGGYIPMGHHDYKPFSELLWDVYERYGRRVLLAETGAEHSARPAWLNYVCGEVREAMKNCVPIEGICIYPITDYPGWDNDRICSAGLFGASHESGSRTVYAPLAEELARQAKLFPNAERRSPVDIIKLFAKRQ